jgi:hypothetical protein
MRRVFFAVTLTLILTGAAFSGDFGLVLNMAAEYASDAAGQGFVFSESIAPWYSKALGGKTNLYLSGKLTFEQGHNKDAWPPVFELERTELNFRPSPAVYLTLGRQDFKDIGKMIASGFFDGFHGNFGFGRARFSLGAFYTGLLYKKTAEILMTMGDLEYYSRPLDYGDPASYFASRRLVAAAAGEFPDLTSRTSLAVSLLAQFDLNSYTGYSALHGQYLETRFSLEAADSLRFFVTGVGGLAETEGADPAFNFAAALETNWEVPGAPPDMFSAELRWGSGAVNKAIRPFMPINGIAQGNIFAPTLSGLMNGRLSYTVRPVDVFSVSATAAIFFRTDLETFTDPELDGASKDRFLGGEIYGQIIWAPQSAIWMTAGAGVFLPGSAFSKEADPRGKVNVGFILSL